MVEFKRVKALVSFPLSQNGVDVRTVREGEEFGLQADMAAGLKAEGKIEYAPEVEGVPVMRGSAALAGGVTRTGLTGVAAEPTKVEDPEDLAAIAANTDPGRDERNLVDDKRLVINPSTVPQDNDDHAARRLIEETVVVAERDEGQKIDPVTATERTFTTTVQEVQLDATELAAAEQGLNDPKAQEKALPIASGRHATIEAAEGDPAMEDKTETAAKRRRGQK